MRKVSPLIEAVASNLLEESFLRLDLFSILLAPRRSKTQGCRQQQQSKLARHIMIRSPRIVFQAALVVWANKHQPDRSEKLWGSIALNQSTPEALPLLSLSLGLVLFVLAGLCSTDPLDCVRKSYAGARNRPVTAATDAFLLGHFCLEVSTLTTFPRAEQQTEKASEAASFCFVLQSRPRKAKRARLRVLELKYLTELRSDGGAAQLTTDGSPGEKCLEKYKVLDNK